MSFHTENLRLYAVTDRTWVGKMTFLEQIEAALKNGVTMLQLREKSLSEDAFAAEAFPVKKLCRQYNVPLIINDSVNVAVKIGADGVHVGMEDQPVAAIRRQMGKDFIIGATAKTVEQAQAAQRAGASYLGVGAIFPSPTKKNAIRITKEQLQEITAAVSIPCVAIGGITPDNILELQGTGIAGVAVVSAIFAAENIGAACAALTAKALFAVT
jgi:thiamine-phosphate pyrophosphorylase